MPKSKTRKNHKTKVAARNAAVKNGVNKTQKAQKEFIMNLIKQEQEKGAFDNVQSGPMMGGPLMGGPLMGGPLSFDGDLLTFDGLGAQSESIIDIPVVDESTIQPEVEEKNEDEGSLV